MVPWEATEPQEREEDKEDKNYKEEGGREEVAGISKVGALEEHLVINNIRSVSRRNRGADRCSREELQARHSHANSRIRE